MSLFQKIKDSLLRFFEGRDNRASLVKKQMSVLTSLETIKETSTKRLDTMLPSRTEIKFSGVYEFYFGILGIDEAVRNKCNTILLDEHQKLKKKCIFQPIEATDSFLLTDSSDVYFFFEQTAANMSSVKEAVSKVESNMKILTNENLYKIDVKYSQTFRTINELIQKSDIWLSTNNNDTILQILEVMLSETDYLITKQLDSGNEEEKFEEQFKSQVLGDELLIMSKDTLSLKEVNLKELFKESLSKENKVEKH